MKKLFVFLLLLVTTAGTIIPCCGADDCCEENILSGQQDNQSEEGTCSPFFACATCSGFVEITKVIQINKLFIEKEVHYESSFMVILPTYSASCWQPPRTC